MMDQKLHRAWDPAAHFMRRVLALALLAVPLGACSFDKMLEVDAPSRLPAENLESPENAGLLVNGAIADFECALGSFVVATGIFTDELMDAQLGAAGWPLDRRDVRPVDSWGSNGCAATQTPGIYVPTSTARWAADNALTKLQEWTDAEVAKRDSLIATAAALAGYSYVQLGTAFCSAAVDVGPELQPAQLFALAEDRFTTALGAAERAQSAALVNLARLGRARTRLYLGRGADAVSDAALIPEGFVYNATAASDIARRYNMVFASNNRSAYYMVEPGARTVTHSGQVDPRIGAVNNNRRAADGTTLWEQTKYSALDSSIPIARWAEAQLIIAEVEGGQTAVDIINRLHSAAGLPLFNSTDEAEIRAHLIEERRNELFLEGHRQYDFLRFNLPFDPAPGEPFPIKGGFYGNARCLPLPDIERYNNPNM